MKYQEPNDSLSEILTIFNSFFFFFVWADLVMILLSDVQCSSFEPVHSVIIESRQTKCHHLEDGTGDRKLVCDRLFAPLFRICSSPSTLSPICALLSGTAQR